MSIVQDNELNLNGNRYSIDRNNVDTSGGNGEVVFATVKSDPQEYAIKVLSSKKTDDKQKRFEQEIKFCTQEHHPNVIKILDYGMHGKHMCYVMKRYPYTLRNVIEKEDDPIRLLEYVVQLCAAVKYVHGKKVIHRDIKPENILIDGSNLVLADFGMAHFIDFSITKSNDLMANRNYAAPEQRKVGESKKITRACDVYAIGAVINELFTKQKPEGTQFVLISDKYPFLSQLDEIVHRCLRQDPVERPGIEAITNEVRLLFAELKKKTESIQKRLLPNISVDLSKSEIDIITRNASFDILSANFLLKEKSLKDLERYNMDYHRNICYNVDNSMKNIYFQYSVLEHCEHKFAYETYTYSKGKPYYSLNLKRKTDAKIYKSFESILNSHPIKKKDVDISGKILKYFSSCCDYHCKELINAVLYEEEKLNELDNSPILYMAYKLKSTLDSDVISEIALEDYLGINWDTAYIGIDENQLINIEFIDDERILLEEFKQEWGISYDKVDKNQWLVSFSSKDEYLKFRNFALDYSKSDYIFEGDVLELVEIKREYEDVVELYPLGEFDINYTLARLFGHKDVL